MLTFRFSGAEGVMTEPEVLTAGMVGKEVKLEFSEEWKGLAKTLVFSNGTLALDVACTGEKVVIPAKILEKPLKRITLGAYGVSGDGKVVIPTVRAEGPVIKPGVNPAGDPALDPELPIWAQLQGVIGDVGDLETEDTSSLVAAINELALTGGGGSGENGATYRPNVDENGLLSWTNDKGMENPAPVNIKGPEGQKGDTGMTGPYFTPKVVDNGDGTMTMSFTPSRSGIPAPGSAIITLPAGNDGMDGYTPVRGTDYWTEADKSEIKSYVDEAILGGAW